MLGEVVKLASICEAIVDCEHKTAPTQSEGIPLIRTTNIANGRIDLFSAKKISEETYKLWTRRLEPRANDLILAREAPVGEVGIIPSDTRVCLGQRTVLLRPDVNKVLPRYLMYLLLTPQMRHELTSRSEGSTVPHLNMSDIRNLPVPKLPSYETQRLTANLLGALDDKIALNQRQNETLEGLARALFQSWFVDFDPVRENAAAVAAGRPLPHPAFPAAWVETPLGRVPQGWRVSTIGDELEFAYGKPLKREDRLGGKIPVYGSKGIVGWHNKQLVNGQGIIIGRKGNAGTVTWSGTAFYPIDTTFYVVPQPRSIQSLLYWLYVLEAQSLPSLASDSAVPGLNRNMAYMNVIAVPTPELVSSFDVYVEPIHKKMLLNSQESQTLAELRDALLPPLIAGRVRWGVDTG